MLWLAFAALSPAAAAGRDAVLHLRAGHALHGTLRGGSVPVSIPVPAGEARLIHVDQLAGDLRVVIATRAGGTPRLIDEFEFGTETLTLAPQMDTNYTLWLSQVSPRDGPASYKIWIDQERRSIEADEQHVRAEDLSTQAKSFAENPFDRDRAIAAARAALSAWEGLNDTESVGRTRLLLGNLLYFKSDWEDAAAQYTVASEACGKTCNSRYTAEVLNNLGLAHLKLGDINRARDELTAAVAQWQAVRLSSGEATAEINLGLLNWQTTEWDSAIRHYQRARRLVRAGSEESATLLNDLGLVFLSMADFRKASMYFSLALRDIGVSEKRSRYRGRILMNFGRAEMFSGNLDVARTSQFRAISLLKRAHDDSGLADAENNLGQVLIRLGRFDDAFEPLRTALNQYERSGDIRGKSSALHHLGFMALKQNRLADARANLERALTLRGERNLNDEAAETAYALALVALQEHNIDEALAHAREALSLVEDVQGRVMGEPLRRSYLSNKHQYAAFYVDTLLGPDPPLLSSAQVAGFFRIAEHFRARALTDLVGEDRIILRLRAPPAFLARRQRIRTQLNAESQRLAALPDTAANQTTISRLRMRIDQLLAEDSELETTLRCENHSYSAALAPPDIDVEQLQQHTLSTGDAILAYSLGDERSIVWAISKDAVTASVLPPRNILEPAARRFIALLSKVEERHGNPAMQTQFRNAGLELSRLLGLRQRGVERLRRLLIIPDGMLHRLPFSTIPVRSSKSGDKAIGLMLEVVQVPSLAVFSALASRSGHAPVSLSAAVFADPLYSASDARMPQPAASLLKLQSATPSPRYRRLWFSQDEIATVERLFSVDRRWIRRGSGASRQAFLSGHLKRYSLLLVSAHAYADDLQPELSHIALSVFDEKGRPTDGMIHLYDLYDLCIPSFVVLSACETAAGKELDGEGLISLERGFLASGATGLLGSPFRVDDEASSVLVSTFLELLKGRRGMSASSALLKTRRILAASARWSDPFYWGTYILAAAWR